MTHDPVGTARASYEAYVRKDRAAIEALIAPGFHFTSPLDNHLDRAAYFARCWPNSERIADFQFIRLTPHGEEVFVTYEGRTKRGERFRNTEVLTIRGSQIVNAEVYFGWSLPHPAPRGGFVERTED
jgi:ketosteroid isomerase-like protein